MAEQVGVILAAALPYLTLSFGFFPSRGDLTAAEDVLCQQLSSLEGWELAAVLWGATHLAYQPRNALAVQEVLALDVDRICELEYNSLCYLARVVVSNQEEKIQKDICHLHCPAYAFVVFVQHMVHLYCGEHQFPLCGCVKIHS